MSFMSRKKQFGSRPNKKPNRHRLNVLGLPPLVYPVEAADSQWTKERIRMAHAEYLQCRIQEAES